jgi:hypothetical protein
MRNLASGALLLLVAILLLTSSATEAASGSDAAPPTAQPVFFGQPEISPLIGVPQPMQMDGTCQAYQTCTCSPYVICDGTSSCIVGSNYVECDGFRKTCPGPPNGCADPAGYCQCRHQFGGPVACFEYC